MHILDLTPRALTGEEIAVLVPITHGHHQSKFQVNLIVKNWFFFKEIKFFVDYDNIIFRNEYF